MRPVLMSAIVAVAIAVMPGRAWAQRFPFERSFDVGKPSKIDVSTLRGKIEIVAGADARIVVRGDATVRIGWDVPANAVELARQVAATPPIEREGNEVRLRRPSGDAAQRGVIVSYKVEVPRHTEVLTRSDSGATSVRGVAGLVDVRTGSGAIAVGALGGAAKVATRSGAVMVEGLSGALAVETESGGFTGRDLTSSVRLRTQSGQIEATLTGTGDVDVDTGSSAIHLNGLNGGLLARTQSGAVVVQGAPLRAWSITTSSSRVDLNVQAAAKYSIDADSRSGSVKVEGGTVHGSVAERAVTGDINGGGPLVRVTSGSGAIRLRIGP